MACGRAGEWVGGEAVEQAVRQAGRQAGRILVVSGDVKLPICFVCRVTCPGRGKCDNRGEQALDFCLAHRAAAF